jgi:hypothetical protein
MTGVIATLAACAVIATLMVVGIRMKLPPPDPDWRDHVPPDPPLRSRLWWGLWLGRLPVWLAAILAIALGFRGLGLALLALMLAMTMAGIIERLVARLRRAQRESQ